jgi:Na+/proline symporter
MNASMHTSQYVVIGAYMALLVAMGIVMRGLNHDLSDYFRNGCRGTWWLVGASAFMTSFSAGTFTGIAGIAFGAGWTVTVIFAANALGFLANYAFLAAWFRQLRAITSPEVICMRFGPVTQQAYAWIGVLSRLLYAAMQLYGLGLFAAAIFGFNIHAVIWVTGGTVMFLSAVGGSWAVTSSDFLQSLVLIPITILVAVLALAQFGGLGGLMHAIDLHGLTRQFQLIKPGTGRFPLADYTWPWVAAIVVKNVVGYNTLFSAERYFGVKDGREARKAALLGAILTLVGMTIFFVPPIAARLLYQKQVLAAGMKVPAEAAYAVAATQLLPNSLLGVMVVAIFASSVSSLDGGLNRNAAVFTRDIFPALCRLVGLHRGADGLPLSLGRIITVCFGVLMLSLASYFAQMSGAGVFDIMLAIGTMVAVPLAVPMLLCLFIRRAPSWSALTSVGAAVVVALLGQYSKQLFGHTWSFQVKLFVNFFTGSAGFLVTMPFWYTASAQYRQRVEAFFERMLTPVDFAREVGKGNDLTQMTYLGAFALVTGGSLCLLMLLAGSTRDRLCIAFVGGSVMLVGCAMTAVGSSARAAIARNREMPAGYTELSTAGELS